MGVILHCHDLYQNLWYLVKKSIPGKYWLVNVAVELNWVTIKDTNLPFSTNELSEKFASYAISSFINFLLGYNQGKLDKKSRELTGFMILLGLVRIITLFQRVTNSVTKFIRIVLKVLGDYLHDWAKPFWDNISIKKPKTTYNNQDLVYRI